MFFDNFKQGQDEFDVLQELSTEILAEMGIILRGLSQNKSGLMVD